MDEFGDVMNVALRIDSNMPVVIVDSCRIGLHTATNHAATEPPQLSERPKLSRLIVSPRPISAGYAPGSGPVFPSPCILVVTRNTDP